MKALYRFFHSDASGGIILMLAAVAAMIVANSPLAGGYRDLLAYPVNVLFLEKPVILWINDLLMAFFFLMAGLEIKRECLVGALASRARAGLPLIAAVCGMVVPAGVYLLLTRNHPEFHHGWAISSATDIAFALGILALASSRIPASIKVLLMAIAVMDDLGAILVIAFFYTDSIGLPFLALAAAATAVLFLLNRLKIAAYGLYFLVGGVLWVALLKAGIHPTIGGVILGFSIPMHNDEHSFSPLEVLEHTIKPWVVFAILPIFGFANAGVSLAGLGIGDILHPVTLAIALGLFIGKQVGIFGSLYLAIKSPYFLMPPQANWLHLYGLSLLCGVGFTMALFIGGLAFDDPAMDAYVRMGVIGGSVLSAAIGYAVLRIASKRPSEVNYE